MVERVWWPPLWAAWAIVLATALGCGGTAFSLAPIEPDASSVDGGEGLDARVDGGDDDASRLGVDAGIADADANSLDAARPAIDSGSNEASAACSVTTYPVADAGNCGGYVNGLPFSLPTFYRANFAALRDCEFSQTPTPCADCLEHYTCACLQAQMIMTCMGVAPPPGSCIEGDPQAGVPIRIECP